MEAIILAAGMSKRLQKLTQTIPKSLLNINGLCPMELHLKTFLQLDFDKVYIVIGYLGEKIVNKFGDKYKNLKIEYVWNKEYEKSGSGYSLYLGLLKVDSFPIICMDADLFYEQKIIENIYNGETESLLVSAHECDAEAVKVYVNGNRIVKLSKEFDYNEQILGESVGIFKLSKEGYDELLNYMESFVKKNFKLFEWEDTLNGIFKKVYFKPIVVNNKWIEIDFEEDFLLAKKLFK